MSSARQGRRRRSCGTGASPTGPPPREAAHVGTRLTLSPPSLSSQAAPPALTQRPRCLMQQSLQGEGVLRRKSGRAQVLISCLHLAKTKPTVLYMHSAKSDWRLPWGPSGGDSKLPSQGPQLGLWTKELRSLRAALPKH